MMLDRRVVIVGGGASGVLTAAALARHADASDLEVTIVEPREELGRGIAYSTGCPDHQLNVPAAKMSAFPDRPDDFVRWLSQRAGDAYGATSFVPRRVYGDYLCDVATAAQTRRPWRHVRALASDVEQFGDRVIVTCSNGERIEAGVAIVASGNAAPAHWPNVTPAAAESKRFFASAWDEGAIEPDRADEDVLLLGTGLTAVDAVLGLRHRGHRGTVTMISRRGLLPHEHRVFDSPPATCPEAGTVGALIDCLREQVRAAQPLRGNWRSVVDAVRPRTNALWQALSLAEQRRFVRHALTYWNVHRHRIPPESAKALAKLMATGDLQTLAGRTERIEASGDRLRVDIVLRGTGERDVLEVDRVINCSGPEHDFRKVDNPVLRSLLARGSMTPYPLGIGVRVAHDGALIDAAGTSSPRLFVVGPARFGTLIETTAIPEIRVQAVELAATIVEALREPTYLADAI